MPASRAWMTAGSRKVAGAFFSQGRESHGIWTNPANDLLYVAHEQDELPGTPNAGQTICTAFDVSDPFSPRFIAQIPLGSLKLPSGELRNKKSINLVYVRPGYRGQTANRGAYPRAGCGCAAHRPRFRRAAAARL